MPEAVSSTTTRSTDSQGVNLTSSYVANRLEDLHNMLDAFNAMNCAVLDDSAGHSDSFSHGIHLLHNLILADIWQMRSEIKAGVAALCEGRATAVATNLQIQDPAVVSRLTGVPVRNVKAVIWAACGAQTDGLEDTMLTDDGALYAVFSEKLRNATLVEAARGTVSELSGQPPEVVEKVLEAVDEAASEFMLRLHKNERSPAARKLDADVEEALRQYRSAKANSEAATNMVDGPIPDHFRQEAVANRLREGIDAEMIAKATNLKPATVECVIEQLTGEPQPKTGTER